jgi:hypothetical protein
VLWFNLSYWFANPAIRGLSFVWNPGFFDDLLLEAWE